MNPLVPKRSHPWIVARTALFYVAWFFLVAVCATPFFKRFVRSKLRIAAPAVEVVGERPDPKHSYVLVEFGDYECPPCRGSAPVVRKFLQANPEFAFAFRHYPLTRIHPLADFAADVAVAVAEQGRFDAIHDALMSGPVDRANVLRCAKSIAVDPGRFDDSMKRRAKEIVARDTREGNLLGIDGTPTFLVCDVSDGSVYRLRSLTDLKLF